MLEGEGPCRNEQQQQSSRCRSLSLSFMRYHTAHDCYVVRSADGDSGASLWHMPEGNAPLQQRAELEVQATRVRALAWHPERADSAVTVEDRSVVQWRFEGASAEVCANFTASVCRKTYRATVT